MGVIFLEHMGGLKLFCCRDCDTALTNEENLVSKRFRSMSGRAYLFRKVVNFKEGSRAYEQMMITGRHFIRDVFCKKCDLRLGWVYEWCEKMNQRYKEGYVILEEAFIKEKAGICEI